MAVSVQMPALGESVTEGTVTRWLKKVGDSVAVDEPLVEVSTDKVDTEIPAPASGVLLSITVGEDQTVAVGASLGSIGSAAAAVPTAAPAAPVPAPVAAAPAPVPAAAPAATKPAGEAREGRGVEGDVGAALAGRLQDSQGHRVTGDDQQRAVVEHRHGPLLVLADVTARFPGGQQAIDGTVIIERPRVVFVQVM